MMRRLTLLAVLLTLLLVAGTGAATAKGKGLTQSEVESRGWACFPGDVMVHCVRPNTSFDPPPLAIPSLNFRVEGGTFLGTEILIRADVGSDGRPCPQGTEPDGTYEPVDFTGDGNPDYYSCHHNNDL